MARDLERKVLVCGQVEKLCLEHADDFLALALAATLFVTVVRRDAQVLLLFGRYGPVLHAARDGGSASTTGPSSKRVGGTWCLAPPVTVIPSSHRYSTCLITCTSSSAASALAAAPPQGPFPRRPWITDAAWAAIRAHADARKGFWRAVADALEGARRGKAPHLQHPPQGLSRASHGALELGCGVVRGGGFCGGDGETGAPPSASMVPATVAA